jgi:phosphate transport system protein
VRHGFVTLEIDPAPNPRRRGEEAALIGERLRQLREQILRMGGLAEAILAKALRSVWERSAALAEEVQRDDLEIDRVDIAIDQTVLRLIALEAPKADDLRAVIAVKMMATDLERVGDLSRNIAKSAARLASRPEVRLPADLERVAEGAQRLLRDSLDSFSSGDTTEARGVIRGDDQVDDAQDRVVERAIEHIQGAPGVAAQQVDVILIAEALERVADHATNVAEAVILLHEGEIVKHADKLRS